MAFNPEDQLEDNVEDAVGRCLRAFNLIPTWTNAKHEMFREFLRLPCPFKIVLDFLIDLGFSAGTGFRCLFLRFDISLINEFECL